MTSRVADHVIRREAADNDLEGGWSYDLEGGWSSDSVADTGGGKPGLCPPPLTNKDTPPVHCNEFNYMSSATHCRSSCRPRPACCSC